MTALNKEVTVAVEHGQVPVFPTTSQTPFPSIPANPPTDSSPSTPGLDRPFQRRNRWLRYEEIFAWIDRARLLERLMREYPPPEHWAQGPVPLQPAVERTVGR